MLCTPLNDQVVRCMDLVLRFRFLCASVHCISTRILYTIISDDNSSNIESLGD